MVLRQITKRGGRFYNLVDLFCGAGGLSFGFEWTGRFRTVLGVDLDERVGSTFLRNHGSKLDRPEFVSGDLRAISNDQILEALARKALGAGDIDVLVGGPPCEGFSQNRSIRKHENGIAYGGYDRWFADPRNTLFVRFLEIAELLQPSVLLIENVPQILTHADGSVREEILGRLFELGYAGPQPRVLFAADFGVPQIRKRAFFLAHKGHLGGELRFPAPTHFSPEEASPQLHLFASPKAPSWPGDRGHFVSVREAIEDLPVAAESNAVEVLARYRGESSAFRERMRSKDRTLANHVARIPSERVRRRLRHLRAGERLDKLPKELRTKSWYFNSYGRLDWEQPAKTITKSCNYLGSGCFGHPEQQLERGITMREAARLQSFPDWFVFEGSEPVQAKMIGSAVPPLVAYRLAEQVCAYLDATVESPKDRAVAR
jgi:DNA (cytosine-5)-methyltransferase 1